jgi:hypothetical protein
MLAGFESPELGGQRGWPAPRNAKVPSAPLDTADFPTSFRKRGAKAAYSSDRRCSEGIVFLGSCRRVWPAVTRQKVNRTLEVGGSTPLGSTHDSAPLAALPLRIFASSSRGVSVRVSVLDAAGVAARLRGGRRRGWRRAPQDSARYRTATNSPGCAARGACVARAPQPPEPDNAGNACSLHRSIHSWPHERIRPRRPGEPERGLHRRYALAGTRRPRGLGSGVA